MYLFHANEFVIREFRQLSTESNIAVDVETLATFLIEVWI